MLRLSSIAMLLLGAAAVGLGIYGGLSTLAGLYQGALEAPLDQPEGAETEVTRNMLTFVIIGAAGFVPLLLGTYFWRKDRLHARQRAEGRR
jgi:hypothetical protein